MKEDQKASLDRINEHLSKIKEEINTYWGPDVSSDNEVNEVVLFIEDKKTNPWRKQTEDIEPDVNDMRLLSR